MFPTIGYIFVIAFMLRSIIVQCNDDQVPTKTLMSRQHWMKEAISYLEKVQNNCKSKQYIRVRLGINGGFSAQFQLMASQFTRTFAAGNFKTPIHVFGMLNGYSEGEECKHVNYEWLCFFRPATKCNFEADGAEELIMGGLPAIEHSVPPEFQHLGVTFWWGAVQRYLFKLQPFVEEHILQESRSVMHKVFSFPFGLPIAGMHVRRGDKHDDGFKMHSFEEVLSLVRKSPDCQVQNVRQECFVKVQLNDTRSIEPIVGLYSSSVGFLSMSEGSSPFVSSMLQSRVQYIIQSAITRRTVIMRLSDIDRYNSSSSNDDIAVNPKKLWHLYRHRIHNSHLQHRHQQHGLHRNSSTSSSNRPVSASRRYLVASNSTTKISAEDQKMLSETYVIPLAIYVASDDGGVINTASKLGYFADVTGVSQQTAANGMFKTLLSHHEFGFNATMEILTDIFFLSHCSTLLGMAASQVYRMSVALSNVTGTLHYAKATDLNQVSRIKMLSHKYDVPFVENFE